MSNSDRRPPWQTARPPGPPPGRPPPDAPATIGDNNRYHRGEPTEMTDTVPETKRPPVQDWATDFDHTASRLRRRRSRDLGRAARPLPGGPHRALRRRLAARPGTPTCAPSPRTPSTSPPRGHRQRLPARAGPRAPGLRPADHLRPAVPRGRPPAAAAAVLARRRSTPWEPMARACCRELLDELDPRRRRRGGRRRHRLRPAHPGPGHRRHARPARGGRRPVPGVHPPHPRDARPARDRRPGRDAGRLPEREDPRATRGGRRRRRPHRLPALGTDDGRRTALPTSTSSAPSPCC